MKRKIIGLTTTIGILGSLSLVYQNCSSPRHDDPAVQQAYATLNAASTAGTVSTSTETRTIAEPSAVQNQNSRVIASTVPSSPPLPTQSPVVLTPTSQTNSSSGNSAPVQPVVADQKVETKKTKQVATSKGPVTPTTPSQPSAPVTPQPVPECQKPLAYDASIGLYVNPFEANMDWGQVSVEHTPPATRCWAETRNKSFLSASQLSGLMRVKTEMDWRDQMVLSKIFEPLTGAAQLEDLYEGLSSFGLYLAILNAQQRSPRGLYKLSTLQKMTSQEMSSGVGPIPDAPFPNALIDSPEVKREDAKFRLEWKRLSSFDLNKLRESNGQLTLESLRCLRNAVCP